MIDWVDFFTEVSWQDIKRLGNAAYKRGEVEQIDLMRSEETLNDFALSSIRKYCTRNLKKKIADNRDLVKIIHYGLMLYVISREGDNLENS